MIKRMLGVLFLFILIYKPPFSSINIIQNVISIFFIIYLVINRKKAYKYLDKKNLILVIGGLYLINLYLLSTALIFNNGITYQYIMWGCITLPIIYSIIIWLGYGSEDIMKLLLVAGGIQATLAIISFLFPEIQDLFLKMMYESGNTYATKLHGAYRLYGLSSNLTFSTPIVQSFLCIISILYSIEKDKKYFFVSFILGMSAVINARISIGIIAMGLIVVIVFELKSMKKMCKILGILCIALLCIYIAIPYMSNISKLSVEWMKSGLQEIVSVMTGEVQEGYFSYVTDKSKYILPEGIGLLFGEGIRIMLGNNKFGVCSDIGYINDIWLGGLIYAFLSYSFIALMLVLLYKSMRGEKKINKIIVVNLAIIFIVGNAKGYIISDNNFMIMFWFLCGIYVLKKQDFLEIRSEY